MPTKKKTRTRTKRAFDLTTVAQVMQKQVQVIHLKTKGDVVASLMIEGFVGAVPVVDSKHKLLGIVSEHDLLAAVDDRHKLSAVVARDIMTCNPLFNPPGSDASDAGACVKSQRSHTRAGSGCERQARGHHC